MKWVLQKWEKEVHVESILHPTPSMHVDGSNTSVAEASSTPLDPIPPSSILSGIAAPSGDHPTSPTRCPSAEQILANDDSQGSFHPSMSEVEALLGNNWRRPLHVTVPGLSPQQFEFEARHFKDLTTENYVIDCAQIVVYYGGLPKPLSVRIGTQWAWRGLSATLCGMPHVPVHNAANS